ncbi:uncharacterized protein A4U43_C05F9650 [Asparagus officinalis]|uniref:Uncharacterized protein n=1 Tax=Asparagus officinalis TaxID=4686 RepID=A0A5P1ER43_ASPOF|nr:uncharacterized protein A4U43_C05F9650 [Asparagus officinalis]
MCILFPLHKEWNDESREKMDDIMELLKDNFIWESGDEDPKNPGFKMPVNMMFVHRWCTLTVQSAIRSWKAKLKKKYYKEWKTASPQQRGQINFERITRNEWENFVNYIDNPNKEVIKRIEELRVELQDADPLTKDHQLTLSSVLDEVAGKRHGGYERGYGTGYKGRTMIHQFSTSYNIESSINNSQLQEELDVAN